MIKLLILDVDGVLTDGKIIYDENGHETKHFNVKDGLGIKLAQKAGIEVAVISGRKSKVTDIRCAELGITRCHKGIKDKNECYESIKKDIGVRDTEVAFIGDDVNYLKSYKKR